MRVAIITTDGRGTYVPSELPAPSFGTAPEALLQGFENLGDVQVDVLSCVQRPVAHSMTRLAANITHYALHVPKTGWLRTGYQGCIRAVRRKLRELKPDIVHGQGTERECALSAVFAGFPNVVTIHGNMVEMARLFRPKPFSYLWLAARVETFTLRRTGGVFCNSAYTESLVAPRTGRVWRVPNPIREMFFDPPSAARATEPCVLTNIGVISPRKRQLELLEVAAQLRLKGLKFRFDFVGQCDGSTDYQRQFIRKTETLGDCVRYVGTLNTRDLIAQLDISSALIHFPMEEAFGLVVCEALSRGLKLFATRTGGIIDIAEGAPGAELFQLNDWAGLEKSLASWIGSGAQRPASVAELMRERFHPFVIARRHVAIYREVLSKLS